MARIWALSEQLNELAAAFEHVDLEFDRAARGLRESDLSHVGGAALSVAVSDVMERLQRRLADLAVQSGAAAAVVRRHQGDGLPASGSQDEPSAGAAR